MKNNGDMRRLTLQARKSLELHKRLIAETDQLVKTSRELINPTREIIKSTEAARAWQIGRGLHQKWL
jgi:hypothetical protein